VNKHAEGAVLWRQGDTHVLCTASVEERVPDFLRNRGKGWITAEYAMLPRATSTRSPRDAVKAKGVNSRAAEISRLIGRTLRASCDLALWGERTVTVDCDVLQADGGTRCAAITGGMVALALAAGRLRSEGVLARNPVRRLVAAVSVGLVGGRAYLDLDYDLDHRAEVDLNVAMTSGGRYVELQGSAEGEPFTEAQFAMLRRLAACGARRLLALQRQAIRAAGAAC